MPLGIFCSTQCKHHNLTINSCRSINSNCRWTLTTNYFQRQGKLNTTHLFRKNTISTVHLQSLINILYFFLLSMWFWNILSISVTVWLKKRSWHQAVSPLQVFNTESTCAKTRVWLKIHTVWTSPFIGSRTKSGSTTLQHWMVNSVHLWFCLLCWFLSQVRKLFTWSFILQLHWKTIKCVLKYIVPSQKTSKA